MVTSLWMVLLLTFIILGPISPIPNNLQGTLFSAFPRLYHCTEVTYNCLCWCLCDIFNYSGTKHNRTLKVNNGVVNVGHEAKIF